MFRTTPLPIIRNFSLYTQQLYMSYRFTDSLQAVHIPLLCIQCKTPDDVHRNCPKHVAFYSKNKFEKLVRLVGFIIRNRFDVLDKKILQISTTFSFYIFKWLRFLQSYSTVQLVSQLQETNIVIVLHVNIISYSIFKV